MIRMTIIHSNDDSRVEDFATVEGAKARAVVLENERHGTKDKPLSHFFGWVSEDRMQFGTGYHYITFEEI